MFKVVKKTKQLNETHENTSVMPFTARESYEEARTAARQLAKAHASDIITKAPLEVEPGQFQFRTSNYTLVTYSVQKENQVNLKDELQDTLDHVNVLIDANEREAKALGVEPFQLDNADGSSPLLSLLATKATLLSAIVNLQMQRTNFWNTPKA